MNKDKNSGSGKRKRSHAGDVISVIIMLVALCVLIVAAYLLYGYYKEYKKGSDEYSDLSGSYEDESEDLDELENWMELEYSWESAGREMRTVEFDGEQITVPVMRNPIDFEELEEINPDIVAWLKVRAIDLSYPVVQGEDNDYYLHHTFEKEEVFSGCLFVNCDNEADFTDQNTIIYGHNMKDGSMFATLKKFQDEETFDKSKYFWIFTKDLIFQYRIFSARVVSWEGDTYRTTFSEKRFSELIENSLEDSVVDNTGVKVTTDNKIVTLSTCTGDDETRFVVVGKLAQIYASK